MGRSRNNSTGCIFLLAAFPPAAGSKGLSYSECVLGEPQVQPSSAEQAHGPASRGHSGNGKHISMPTYSTSLQKRVFLRQWDRRAVMTHQHSVCMVPTIHKHFQVHFCGRKMGLEMMQQNFWPGKQSVFSGFQSLIFFSPLHLRKHWRGKILFPHL